MKLRFLFAGIAISMLCPSIAQAQLKEVRFGANIHDVDWTGFGTGPDKERSIALNGELVFETPDFLDWAFSPKPYIGGTLNLEGETSYGGAGLSWRFDMTKNVYFDFSFGLAVHDGTLEVTPSSLVQNAIDDPNFVDSLTEAQIDQFQIDVARYRDRQNSEIDFGSRLLFRQQIALGQLLLLLSCFHSS